MNLALYTFGQFIKPADHPANDDFHTLNDQILELMHEVPGFIARSGYASDPGPVSWGEEVYPEFYVERGDEWSPATLSLWENLEAPFAFTYFGLHATALKRGREWFQKPNWPPLVLWWHTNESVPTWREGVSRHKRLHDHGPTCDAFTFKQAFNQNGTTVKLDKAYAQTLANRT